MRPYLDSQQNSRKLVARPLLGSPSTKNPSVAIASRSVVSCSSAIWPRYLCNSSLNWIVDVLSFWYWSARRKACTNPRGQPLSADREETSKDFARIFSARQAPIHLCTCYGQSAHRGTGRRSNADSSAWLRPSSGSDTTCALANCSWFSGASVSGSNCGKSGKAMQVCACSAAHSEAAALETLSRKAAVFDYVDFVPSRRNRRSVFA